MNVRRPSSSKRSGFGALGEEVAVRGEIKEPAIVPVNGRIEMDLIICLRFIRFGFSSRLLVDNN
jgi:hypothetical protein